MDFNFEWTTEQILGFAPDHHIAKSGRSLAKPGSWRGLHRNGGLIWGYHPIVRNRLQKTIVNLQIPAFACDCASRKTPCKHALALFLLGQQQPNLFKPLPTRPDWIAKQADRWTKTARRSERTAPQDASADPRLAAIQGGMADLGRWLEDLISSGLGRLNQRPKESWEQIANRLVNGQAIQTAEEIRELAKIARSEPDHWPETLMRRLGQLYLLTEAFARFDEHDLTVQTDLLAAVGRLPRRFDAETVSDRWLVTGRRTQQVGKQLLYRTWLIGQKPAASPSSPAAAISARPDIPSIRPAQSGPVPCTSPPAASRP